MFEADKREDRETLCKIKPRLHGQGESSSKGSVRSWSPNQLLHLISPSGSSMLSEVRAAPVRCTEQEDSLVL